MAKNVKPQKRGMVTALALACLVVFAGLVALRARPDLRQRVGSVITGEQAPGDTNGDVSARDILGNIFAPRANSATSSAPSTPAADQDSQAPLADRVTMRLAERGAIVGDATLLSGNRIQVGGQVFVLWGIQIPASNYQCITGSRQWFCGDEATRSLRDFIGIQKVGCYPKGQDLNGRTLGRCFVGYIDVGSQLVEQGWALQLPRVTNDYNMVQELAKAHRVGLWATDFDPTAFLNSSNGG